MIRTISTFILMLCPAMIFAQCMHSDFGLESAASSSVRIVEAEVVAQHSFIDQDGNIKTVHTLDIFKEMGQPVIDGQVIVQTEGGIVGDLAQVVYPSISMAKGEIVLCFMDENGAATKKLTYDKASRSYWMPQGKVDAEHVYQYIGDAIGNHLIGFRRLMPTQNIDSRIAPPSIANVSPSVITAGTYEEITITGSSFGASQGNGFVSFSNADDGGQSQVVVLAGPHYLSWTDSEIKMYVPSSMLFANVIAGSGLLRVSNDAGAETFSSGPVSILFAKGEVLYQGNLGETDLVDRTNGGYEFTMGTQLQQIAGATDLAELALEKWACNTGANFVLNQGGTGAEVYEVDGLNVIGMAAPGQLPQHVLGKTITTFSACGGGNDFTWHLLEMDMLFNQSVEWYIGAGSPASTQYDLLSVMLHELGHGHLMQHNNNHNSVMYFELNIGDSKRFINTESDLSAGLEIVDQSVNYSACGSNPPQYYDNTNCNLGVLNTIQQVEHLTLSVFPSPSNGTVTIQSETTVQQVKVLDAMGRLIRTLSSSSKTVGLDLTDLPHGVYQLQIDSETGTHVKQVVLF